MTLLVTKKPGLKNIKKYFKTLRKKINDTLKSNFKIPSMFKMFMPNDSNFQGYIPQRNSYAYTKGDICKNITEALFATKNKS